MAEAVILTSAQDFLATLPSKVLRNKLPPRRGQVVIKLWGVTDDLVRLKRTVEDLQAVLLDAEERYYESYEIEVWVQKLKDAFYDAVDVLEEFNIEASRRELRGHNEIRTFFSSSNQLAFKLKMSNKVRAVRERIQAIKAEKKFHLDERSVPSQVVRRERHSFVREGEIKGRDDDKETVMKFLLDSDKKFLLDSDMNENVSILPIVGIGGIGKTALAKLVFNDRRVSEHFHLKMWVTVSFDFDVQKIVKAMVGCMGWREPTEVPMEMLQYELLGGIDGKRYLLVLDDMWNVGRAEWETLKDLLDGGARGSWILITTRINLDPGIIGTTWSYRLEALSEDASLGLLLQMACYEEEYTRDPKLLDLGREIARKCSGVPLVIRAVGALLYCKGKHKWLHFLNSELPEVPQIEDRVMRVLRLSYDYLPSRLKQCFAFCSLFPKDYEIKKQTLINLWVAEGFIQPWDGSLHLEDIAHSYFMELLRSNFFQDFQKDSFTNKETCRMPALMHDLARSVAGSECWNAGDKPVNQTARTRHLSHGLTSKLMREHPIISRLEPRSLRTILSVPTYLEMEQRKLRSQADLCQLIQSFKRLRVFDLHAAIVNKVPRSICKLKHLTYLDLSHNNALKRLPNSITRLHNLQTLNLQGCSALEELPRDIGKLVNLRNLDIDHCYSLSYVPRGLKQLTSLHRLTRFILPKGKARAKNYCGLGELNGLEDLSGSLSIENLGHSSDALEESREANLAGKPSLESLVLRWHYLDIDDAEIKDEAMLEGLKPHKNLQQLTIGGYEGERFPNWMMDSLVDSLPELVEVRLLGCGRIKRISQLGRLPHLKSLELWWLTELEDIESDQSPSSTTSFPSLLKLEIRCCTNLKTMPQTPHLEELSLTEVNQEFFTRMIGLNKLKRLDISQMEFPECLPEEWLRSLTSLERLRISDCPQLTSLSVGMRHLENLKDLSLSNCEELDLCKDKSGNILDLQGLEKLRSVDILGVPKLASLPQWLLRVNNLEHLSIKKCSNLKALPEQIEDLRSLQKLEIIRCPSVTSVPKEMRRLPSLTHLRIAGCPELEESFKNYAREHQDWIERGIRISYELEYYERH